MDILLDRLIRAFPEQFLLRLRQSQTPVYQLSVEAAFSTLQWGKAEAMSVLPHVRRGLFEAEVRRAGEACGLDVSDSAHAGENCSCVTVRADGLVMTAHYVDGPGEFVRDAESRKQNAAVNEWMGEHCDERLLVRPLPRVGRKPIYLNLLHGGCFDDAGRAKPTLDPSTFFLRVCVPAADGSRKYVRNWNALEILSAYASIPVAQAAGARGVEDKAQPRRKAPQRTREKA